MQCRHNYIYLIYSTFSILLAITFFPSKQTKPTPSQQSKQRLVRVVVEIIIKHQLCRTFARSVSNGHFVLQPRNCFRNFAILLILFCLLFESFAPKVAALIICGRF